MEAPIIGILTQETYIVAKYLPENSYNSFIAASYVKFLEGAGARVVPVWIGQNREYYERVVTYTNGILFPGGGTYFNETHGYGEAARQIYNLTLELNARGVYYPILGICLGMQALAFSHIGTDIRIGGGLKHIAVPLDFTEVLGARQIKFREAVLQSNLTLLIDCLGLGVNPNTEVDDGNYALHVATEKCDFPVLQILLSRSSIVVDKQNREGFTPLMVACIVNCREAVQIFLRHGANPNAENNNGQRPLHYACENRSMGVVFDLVSKGASINDCRNVFDVTPLAISVVDRPSMPIAKFLLRKGAKEHWTKHFPLFLESALACASHDQLAMFKLLVHNGMNRHQLHPIEHRNCFHYVAISGYAPLAEYLITLNMESDLFVKDATGRTPMDLALDHSNFLVFHLLKFAYLRRRIVTHRQSRMLRNNESSRRSSKSRS